MDMKNTVILLIFLLSILGLIVGVCYTEDSSSDSFHKNHFERVYEDSDGVLTITLEKKESMNLDKNIT